MSNPRDKLHGTVINFKDIGKSIPIRDKFLDKALTQKIHNDMSNGKPLLFMPNSTYDEKPMQEAEFKRSKYKLVLFGILENGSRASICINEIEPFFEVKIPDSYVKDDKIEKFANDIFDDLMMEGPVDFHKFQEALDTQKKMPEFGFKILPTRHEITRGKPLHNYQEHESYYVKIYFEKLSHRKDAILYLRSLKYLTAHDDLNSYYRVVSRDYLLPLANWLTIKNYKVDGNNAYIKNDVIQVSIDDIETYVPDGEMPKHLLKDNTMTMAFDIETFNASNDGEIPEPEYKSHNMFMISMAFQMYYASDQLLSVCLVDVPSAPHPDFLTIICNTEENLIRGFALLFDKLKPELIMGFNSDNYDWKWIVERAQHYRGLLAEIVELFDLTIMKDRTDEKSIYSYKPNSIKIEATLSVDGKNLQTPGFIPFDVMTMFRQLYPTSGVYNLNFFLSKNKLGGKEDMPYQEMFGIYRESLKLVKSGKGMSPELLEKMALVAKYCVVDSIRCHDLTSIRNVLQDKRELANLSYTSTHDAFYRANGMKVRNLVISRGNLRNLKISNIANEKVEEGKFPGAWVFPPVKGLIVSKLSIRERIEKAKQGYKEYSEWLDVTEEEIQKYVEIIGTYLETDKTSLLKNDILTQAPKHVQKMIEEQTGRPITGLDYSSLYPSLMMTYNLSPEYMITSKKYAKKINGLKNEDGTKRHNLHKVKFDYNGREIRGWSVRHDNKIDPTQLDCKFGLFPTILKDLFDTRSKLKKGPGGLNYLEHEIERLRTLPKEEFDLPETQEYYADVCFKFAALDSKQRALKVYMNTYYGESGNKRSPLFMLEVAGGVTTAGRDNIKKAYKYVADRECKVYYGDSVSFDTPILIRYTKGALTGNIDIRTIDNIPGIWEDEEERWEEYPQFKPSEVEPIRMDKQQHLPEAGLETWTAKGWAPIKRIIRHKTNKKIFRVNTPTGCVDVTEDHSLLTNKMESLSPKDAKIGDTLFHSFPTEFPSKAKFKLNEIVGSKSCIRCYKVKPIYEFYSPRRCNHCRECEFDAHVKNGDKTLMEAYFSVQLYLNNAGKNITEKEAWVWGAFQADGSCNAYYNKTNNYSWSIVKKDLIHLNKIKEYLEVGEPDYRFKVMKIKTGVNRIVPLGRMKTIVEKYRKLFYDKRGYKIVPMCILNSPLNIRKAYWDGFYAGDGSKTHVRETFCQRGKVTMQGLYYLMRSIGFDTFRIYNYIKQPDIYQLRIVKNEQPCNILNITNLSNIEDNIRDDTDTKDDAEDVDLVEQLENITINDSSTNGDTQYVYDIETETGTFQAGVGNMILLNTDSLYISMPEKEFKQLDIDYYTEKISKQMYWEKMIEITFEIIKPLNVGVNQMLFDDNGTGFLKMAYEEALFPCGFLAKKKYFGIPHISKPNFNLDKNDKFNMFIRGLALKTRGVSEVLIEVCSNILQAIVNPTNILTIMEIVKDSIVKFYKKDWTSPELYKAFIMTGVYKPNKKNVKMLTFRERMYNERGIELIPGDRIKYVVVKKYPYKFDLRGRKTALSVGDTMELAEEAYEENLPINIDYYMEKTINGQLARFITYHEDFQVHVNNYDDLDELKKAELQILKNARKYVDTYCKQYYTNYSNKGGIYKNIFKKSATIVKNKIIEQCGNNEASNVIIKLLGFSVDPDDNLEEWITSRIHSLVEKKPKNKLYGEKYVNELLSPASLKKNDKTKSDYILDLQETFYANKTQSILKITESYYNDRQQILELRFRQSINLIKGIYHMNNNIIDTVSTHIKSIINIDNMHNASNNINTIDNINEKNDAPKDLDIYLETSGVDIDQFDKSLNDIATKTIQNKSQKLFEGISELKFIYYNLMSNYETIYHIRSIVDYLKILRNKKIGLTKPPSKKTTSKMIESFVNDSINSMDF